MTFKQMKVAWFLFKLGFKIRMMSPVKREMYIAMYRLNVDLRPDLTTEQKEATHKFLDGIVDK